MEIEIGRGKKARRAYGFDEIAIVPSRRTRNADEVDISWKLGPYRFELPLLASPTDAVVSPETAKAIGRMGGLAVLDLEGLWTRHEDPERELRTLAGLPDREGVARLRELYRAPVRPELLRERIQDVRSEPGVVVAGSLTPQRVTRHLEDALDAGLDILVVHSSVISAEHVVRDVDAPGPDGLPRDVLNLKELVAEVPVPVVLGGCSSYHTGLHLMRTGAAGVLVGVGSGAGSTTRRVLGVGLPQATAIADVAGARSTHVLETGEYVQVIADGGMRAGGDLAKAIACGADAVMLGGPLAHASDAPGRGWHWTPTIAHRELPRGARVRAEPVGTLEEVLLGPAADGTGTTNLVGSLRRSMAVCGSLDLAEFNRAEIAVAPAASREGAEIPPPSGLAAPAETTASATTDTSL